LLVFFVPLLVALAVPVQQLTRRRFFVLDSSSGSLTFTA